MLAHSLLVEAIEDNFVPVAVYNNVGGKDKQTLNRFNEPAWNYQVMRFMDQNANDILPRRDKVWTLHATAERVARAIKTSGKKVPSYLSNIVLPESSPSQREVVFAMYCFWTGEAKLGSLEGVITTEAGFFDRKEVVRVKYDPKKIALGQLIKVAESFKCADGVYLADKKDLESSRRHAKNAVKMFDKRRYRRAPESDQKRQLRSRKRWAALGLSPMQATKINALQASRNGEREIVGWLSPRQRKQLARR